MRVLFVDDNSLMLRNMQVSLKDYFEIDVATNYRQTSSLILRHKYDVIFLDYEMPDMNGEEVMKRIHSIEGMSEIPIVFLTGTSDRTQVMHLLSLKPAGYLIKPVNVNQVIETVAKATNNMFVSTKACGIENPHEILIITEEVLSIFMQSNIKMQEFLKKIAALCSAEVSNISAKKYIDHLAWLKKSTIHDVETMLEQNGELAYELAKPDFEVAELDVISTNTALKYLCKAELVVGEYDKDKIKEFYALTETDENKIKAYTDNILEYRKKWEEEKAKEENKETEDIK